MADGPGSPAGGSHESGGDQSPRSNVREQDRFLPIANISRIMKKALPANGKIAKDAKDTVQECVSEFISFITSEASDKCQKEKRKTINGDDLLWAMATLGFEDYIDPLKAYLARYRELEELGSMSNLDFLFVNGVVSPPSQTLPVATVLESHPGAYTTSRTHNNGSVLLFWERHLSRLANSARILNNSNPELLFHYGKSRVPFSAKFSNWDLTIKSLVNDSMRNALPLAVKEMKVGEELAVTTLLSGNLENMRGNEGLDDEEMLFKVFDVYIRVALYVPLGFGVPENVAHLAAVGPGRDVANAKYSDWVRVRKHLEELRPPSATELLLSNDGDQMLEGCLTNFFVVCRKDGAEDGVKAKKDSTVYEVQTAPISEGVLPGVIRQIIVEACLKHGIPLREVAPSWSQREQWEEAFITNSLRLLQHVETIRVPCSWKSLESKSWKDLTWEEKQFEEGPGTITSIIQEEIMVKAALEGFPVTSFP